MAALPEDLMKNKNGSEQACSVALFKESLTKIGESLSNIFMPVLFFECACVVISACHSILCTTGNTHCTAMWLMCVHFTASSSLYVT